LSQSAQTVPRFGERGGLRVQVGAHRERPRRSGRATLRSPRRDALQCMVVPRCTGVVIGQPWKCPRMYVSDADVGDATLPARAATHQNRGCDGLRYPKAARWSVLAPADGCSPTSSCAVLLGKRAFRRRREPVSDQRPNAI